MIGEKRGSGYDEGNNINRHGKIMKEAADHDEYVEYSVVVTDAFPGKENNADRIGDAAGYYQSDGCRSKRPEQRLDRKNSDPPHQQIADSRYDGEPVTEQKLGGNADNGEDPDKSKQIPAESTADCHYERSIRPGDKKIYAAVIDHLQPLFERG